MLRRRFVLALLLVALLFGVYSPALPGPFLWDDKTLIASPGAQEGSLFGEMYPGTGTNYVRPLVLASFRLQRALTGPSAFLFHVLNVFLLAGAGLGAAALAFVLTRHAAIAWMTGFFFALHPVHAEAVAYISGRADTFLALFVFWACVFYVTALRSEERRFRSTGLVLSLLCFGAALISKEAAFVLPVALMSLDRFLPVLMQKRRPWIIFGALALLFLVLRLTSWNAAAAGDIFSKKGLGWGVVGLAGRSGAFLKAVLLGAGELVIPVGLHMEKRLAHETFTVAHLSGLLIFSGVFAVAYRRALAHSRVLRWSLFWGFLWFLPQSPLVFPDYFADHFLVLSSWTWALVLAVFLSTLRGRVIPAALATGYAVCFAVVTWNAAGDWSDEVRFFERVVAKAPHSVRAREELGRLYLERRRPEAADLFMGFFGAEGTVSAPADLDAWGEKILRSPDPQTRSRETLLLYHAGLAWHRSGRPDLAERAYSVVLRIDPVLGKAHNNLGSLLLESGRIAEAFEHFMAATTLDPRDPAAFNNLGVVCARLGMEDAARRHWIRALALDPQSESAKRNLEASKELEKSLT